jgi:predicted nucleic acid-binding protein
VNCLFDINIISEVRKGRRCDPNVASWYEKIEDASLYLSVLVIGEIRKGIERIRPKDTIQAYAIENWLIAVDKAFGERILPIDRAVANEWGRLNASRPLPVIDGRRRPLEAKIIIFEEYGPVWQELPFRTTANRPASATGLVTRDLAEIVGDKTCFGIRPRRTPVTSEQRQPLRSDNTLFTDRPHPERQGRALGYNRACRANN